MCEIFLSETKIDTIDEQIIIDKLPVGYSAKFKSRKYCSNTSSGGIGIIFKQVFANKIDFLPSDNDFVIWCKVDTGNLDKDIILGSIYIPPEGSAYFNQDMIENLELEVVEKQIQNEAYVLLGGDFNARTGSLSDILSDNDPDLGCPDYFRKDCPVKTNRKNCDRRTNNLGYGLVNLCTSTNLFIVNGRTNGDLEGNFTFKGTSVLDYFVCSYELVDCIDRFSVLPFNPMLSDGHCVLSLEMFVKDRTDSDKTVAHAAGENVNPVEYGTPLKSKKVKWDRDRSEVFKDSLRVDTRWNEVQNNISNPGYRTQDGIDNIVSMVSEMFLKSAENSGMVKESNTGKVKSNPKGKRNFKWFNNECKNARTDYEISKRRYHGNKSDENLRFMKNMSKVYKNTIRRAKQTEEKDFANNLRRLQSDDPKKFWSLLNENGKPRKTHESPTLQEFFTHFAALYDTDEDVAMPDAVFEEINDSSINEPFSTQEVLKGIKSLKNNKAPGADCITNEMLKNVPPNALSAITTVFNLILDTGIVPTTWASGLIKPIYKNKGDAKNVDNYRAITLVSCFGKLFTSLLNNRITALLEENNALSEAQAGFRSGHSTIDHIFALKAIVELYLSQGRRLFCAFVDYRKAFDTVSRTILWRKLLAHGIQGKIFNVITNLYMRAKACVVANGCMSDFFDSKIGVKQGENLSPLLFSLFLNDIENFFLGHGGSSLGFIGRLYNQAHPEADELFWFKLFIILYADDTVILAESEKELQQQLDALHEYCIENKLSVNATKTKVMVFARSKARLRNIPDFRYGDSVLEVVENYTYLGIVFSWNGKFDKAKQELAKKATRAMFAIIQKGRRMNLEIDLMLKLFDACVMPILLYGSEVWGYERIDVLEKVHTRFCKIILHCSKFTHNSMIYGELGRYPIRLEIDRRMINFWSRLQLESDQKFSCVMYRILFHLVNVDRHDSLWVTHIRSLFQNTGFNYIWLTQQVPNCIYAGTALYRVFQQQFLQNWTEKMYHNTDFTNYRIFKTNIEREKYLSVLPDHLLKSFTEFRTGSYRLTVNNHRSDLPRNERICRKCNINEIDDEFHFLLQCPILADIRARHIPLKYYRNPNILKMQDLLQNGLLINRVARFVFEGFKRLNEL